MAATEAFYGVALTLLPALLFGGAVIAVPRSYGVIGRVVTAVLAAAILLALLFAIQGTIDPVVSDLQQRYIVFVLVAGTVAASLAAVARPSIADAKASSATETADARRGESGAASESPKERQSDRRDGPRWLLAGAVAGGVVLAVGAAGIGITASLDRADARSTLERAERARADATVALAGAENQVVATRTSTITTLLGVGPQTSAVIGNRVQEWITAIDRVVQPVLSERAPARPTLTRAREQLRKRSSELHDVLLGDLERGIEAGRLDQRAINRVVDELFLVNLAATELIRAERSRLAAKASAVAAGRRYERARDEPSL